MHMHYAFESVVEFLHSFRFVIQKVCRIYRSRRFVLESFPQGVIVVPIEVMVRLILTLHGWKGKKGKKAFCLHLILWYRLWALYTIGQAWWCHRFSQIIAIVHLVPMQWFTVYIREDGCSVMSCFCMSLCIVQRIHSLFACGQRALRPSRPAEAWNFSVLEVFKFN